MKKVVFTVSLAAVSAFGQYKLDSAGPPPAGLAPAIRDVLQKDGAKISGPKSTVCEVWLRAKSPVDGSNSEENVSFTNVSHGTLLGVIRFPVKATDRRGQTLQAGIYTMRLSFYPVDGTHQGIAPTRDFLLLVPAANDQDPNATPKFDELVVMSRKASGTKHPAILNAWKPDGARPTALKHEGDDWVLYSSMGDTPIAIILIGTYQG